MYKKTKYGLKPLIYPLFISATLALHGCSGVPEVGGSIAEPLHNASSTQIEEQPNVRPLPPLPRVPSTPTTQPQQPLPNANGAALLAQANQLIRQGKKREAAQAYFQASAQYAPPKRERIVLQAAELAASMGDSRTTQKYLNTIPRAALQGENGVRFNYVQALLALQLKNPNKALSLLPPANTPVSSGLKTKLAHIRSKALAQQSKPAASTITKPLPSTNTHTTKPTLPSTTNKLAVLLPKSGRLSGVGAEIFKGIQHAQAKVGASTRIKLYDVSQGGALAQYKAAVSEGADMVVGPLDKASIQQLLSQPAELSKPILSLNYIGQGAPVSLYQFGLSPEDEVRQIAEFAIRRRQNNALVMTPNSQWGQRLQQAFTQAYKAQGGKVLHAASYSGSDYNAQVQAALAKTQGKAQMVFVAASPSQARAIRPVLKTQAGILPVYATSHIFSGTPNPSLDRNLDGIIYTEIPWVLESQKAGRLGQDKYPRMFALGIDAFVIAKNLSKLSRSNSVLRGKTGYTRLMPNRNIQRRLDFATFANGLPKPLGQ